MSCDCNYDPSVLEPSGYVTPPSEWAPCIVNMVRAHIGDYSDPPMYSDSRLFQVIVAAAYLVRYDVESCDIDMPEISCDGAISPNPLNYPSFVNLVVLKSACMLDRGMMRARFQVEGISATCGPAMLKVTGGSSAYDAFMKYGACAAYDELKKELCFLAPLRSAKCAHQIVSYFISDHYGPGCGTGCEKR